MANPKCGSAVPLAVAVLIGVMTIGSLAQSPVLAQTVSTNALVSSTGSSAIIKGTGMTTHFVAFKYKDTTTAAQKEALRAAFLDLRTKIPFIVSLTWGSNTSPENLNKGMSDGFLLTFKSAADRDAYLIHPQHEAFKALALPMVADAFVFDFAENSNPPEHLTPEH